MGLCFDSPLGLAAGFDRSGMLIGTAGQAGFGAIEIGSMAAGSRDFCRVVAALHASRPRFRRARTLIVGVSLTPPPDQSLDAASVALASAVRGLHGLAGYVTLNPGRSGLAPAEFHELVGYVAAHATWPLEAGTSVPKIMVKLPPVWAYGSGALRSVSSLADAGASGVLVSAQGCAEREHVEFLRQVRRQCDPSFCLASVGGIDAPRDALRRLAAGATLIQIHGAARRSRRAGWLADALALMARARNGGRGGAGPHFGYAEAPQWP